MGPKGLAILAFPSDDFKQEARTNEELIAWKAKHGFDFEIFAKIHVNGPETDPFFTFLKNGTDGGDIGWNFGKFLVGRDGLPVKRYGAHSSPFSFKADIEAELAKSAPGGKL